MTLFWGILLSILAIIVVIGIIRVAIKQPADFGELLLELLLLDVLFDLLGAIFEGLGDIDL